MIQIHTPALPCTFPSVHFHSLIKNSLKIACIIFYPVTGIVQIRFCQLFRHRSFLFRPYQVLGIIRIQIATPSMNGQMTEISGSIISHNMMTSHKKKANNLASSTTSFFEKSGEISSTTSLCEEMGENTNGINERRGKGSTRRREKTLASLLCPHRCTCYP